MDSNKKLSIIIPTYNRRILLERALNSVLSQNGDFEVIVVDDAGSDGTESFVKKFSGDKRLKYIKKERNGGVNSARNLGIKHALGEWIAFLDDDDEFLTNAVNIIFESIENLPDNFGVAYFNSIIETDTSRYVGGFQFKDEEEHYDPNYRETMTKFNLKGDCKPVFRKIIFENKRYSFPESVNGFESYTMNILAKDGVGIRYFKKETTLVHFTKEIKHISHTAPRKNPWPLLVLHTKQIPEHFIFYVTHPIFFGKKLVTMVKLFIRSILVFIGSGKNVSRKQ